MVDKCQVTQKNRVYFCANRKGRSRAGHSELPQSNEELQWTRAARLGLKRERDQF